MVLLSRKQKTSVKGTDIRLCRQKTTATAPVDSPISGFTGYPMRKSFQQEPMLDCISNRVPFVVSVVSDSSDDVQSEVSLDEAVQDFPLLSKRHQHFYDDQWGLGITNLEGGGLESDNEWPSDEEGPPVYHRELPPSPFFERRAPPRQISETSSPLQQLEDAECREERAEDFRGSEAATIRTAYEGGRIYI